LRHGRAVRRRLRFPISTSRLRASGKASWARAGRKNTLAAPGLDGAATPGSGEVRPRGKWASGPGRRGRVVGRRGPTIFPITRSRSCTEKGKADLSATNRFGDAFGQFQGRMRRGRRSRLRGTCARYPGRTLERCGVQVEIPGASTPPAPGKGGPSSRESWPWPPAANQSGPGSHDLPPHQSTVRPDARAAGARRRNLGLMMRRGAWLKGEHSTARLGTWAPKRLVGPRRRSPQDHG